MRILSLTAGAGQMYCGSCLRDNALAAELLARGHDVMLQPVYTPTLTDEANVSGRPRADGRHQRLPRPEGAAVPSHAEVARSDVGCARGDPRGHEARHQHRSAHARRHDRLDAARRGRRLHARRWRSSRTGSALEPPPDLTVLPNSLLISLAAPIARATRRPVGVTLQGEDLFLDGLEEPYRTESLRLMREHAASVDGFFAVSALLRARHGAPARMSSRAGSMSSRSASRHGTSSRGGPRDAAPPRIGFFGRIAPEKGLHVLCEAYRVLRQSGASAAGDARGRRIPGAGAPAVSRGHRAARCRRAGLAAEFHYHGALDRTAKLAFLRSLDVFSMPATYDEPKALSVIEALAAGVPVVQPRLGAFTEIIENTGGGLLVPPNDIDALAGGHRACAAGSRGVGAPVGGRGVRRTHALQHRPRGRPRARGLRRARPDGDPGLCTACSSSLTSRSATTRRAAPWRCSRTHRSRWRSGEAAAIMGPSGSGKSTLLYMLGALEPPTSGSITLDGQNPFELAEPQLARVPEPIRRLRVSGPPAAAAMFGARERARPPRWSIASATRRQTASARSTCWRASASRTGWSIVRASSPAASASVRPSRAPSSGSRGCCSATSRPATSIGPPPPMSLPFSSTSTAVRTCVLIVVTHSAPLAECLPTRYDIRDGRLTPA